MNRNRIWILAASLIGVLALVGGWFLGVDPQLKQASAADAERATVETLNRTSELTLAKLKGESAGLPGLRTELATLRAALPSDPAVSAFVGEVSAVAKTSGVTVVGLASSDAQVVTPPEPAATPKPDKTPAPAPTPTVPAANAGNAAGAAGSGAAASAGGAATPAAGNLVAIPLSLTAQGDYPKLLDFVAGLQSARRLFLVNSLSIAPPPAGTGAYEASIAGVVYVLLSPTG